MMAVAVLKIENSTGPKCASPTSIASDDFSVRCGLLVRSTPFFPGGYCVHDGALCNLHARAAWHCSALSPQLALAPVLWQRLIVVQPEDDVEPVYH